LTNKSNLIDVLIRYFDNLVVAYFLGHPVYVNGYGILSVNVFSILSIRVFPPRFEYRWLYEMCLQKCGQSSRYPPASQPLWVSAV